MANEWNPLFDLMDSSLLILGPDAAIVFVILLSRADKEGEVRAISPIAISDRLRISVERVEKALKRLQEADPHSRTRENGGAHLAWIEDDECWLIPSHEKWRRLASQARAKERAAERQQRKRDRDAGRCEVAGCDTLSGGELDGQRVCSAHAFEREPGEEG